MGERTRLTRSILEHSNLEPSSFHRRKTTNPSTLNPSKNHRQNTNLNQAEWISFFLGSQRASDDPQSHLDGAKGTWKRKRKKKAMVVQRARGGNLSGKEEEKVNRERTLSIFYFFWWLWWYGILLLLCEGFLRWWFSRLRLKPKSLYGGDRVLRKREYEIGTQKGSRRDYRRYFCYFWLVSLAYLSSSVVDGRNLALVMQTLYSHQGFPEFKIRSMCLQIFNSNKIKVTKLEDLYVSPTQTTRKGPTTSSEGFNTSYSHKIKRKVELIHVFEKLELNFSGIKLIRGNFGRKITCKGYNVSHLMTIKHDLNKSWRSRSHFDNSRSKDYLRMENRCMKSNLVLDLLIDIWCYRKDGSLKRMNYIQVYEKQIGDGSVPDRDENRNYFSAKSYLERVYDMVEIKGVIPIVYLVVLFVSFCCKPLLCNLHHGWWHKSDSQSYGEKVFLPLVGKTFLGLKWTVINCDGKGFHRNKSASCPNQIDVDKTWLVMMAFKWYNQIDWNLKCYLYFEEKIVSGIWMGNQLHCCIKYDFTLVNYLLSLYLFISVNQPMGLSHTQLHFLGMEKLEGRSAKWCKSYIEVLCVNCWNKSYPFVNLLELLTVYLSRITMILIKIVLLDTNHPLRGYKNNHSNLLVLKLKYNPCSRKAFDLNACKKDQLVSYEHLNALLMVVYVLLNCIGCHFDTNYDFSSALKNLGREIRVILPLLNTWYHYYHNLGVKQRCTLNQATLSQNKTFNRKKTIGFIQNYFMEMLSKEAMFIHYHLCLSTIEQFLPCQWRVDKRPDFNDNFFRSQVFSLHFGLNMLKEKSFLGRLYNKISISTVCKENNISKLFIITTVSSVIACLAEKSDWRGTVNQGVRTMRQSSNIWKRNEVKIADDSLYYPSRNKECNSIGESLYCWQSVKDLDTDGKRRKQRRSHNHDGKPMEGTKPKGKQQAYGTQGSQE